ncbi:MULTISPECIES: ATP-binding protein [Methylotenera]|uniref:ATP-binding protein n=1 Tax=Methylotenera TaxID=359407 RepID=UPI000373248E|nr:MULTISPECIES: ATP-binding protein [Methylotenera]
MTHSIKRFLFVNITLAIIVIYALISVVSYMTSKSELDELYDANLEQVANTIAARHVTLRDTATNDVDAQKDKNTLGAGGKIQREQEFYVRIIDNQDHILYVSHAKEKVPATAMEGFSTQAYKNKKWRLFTIKVNEETIQVAQSLKLRNATITETALSLLAPQLLFIPVLVLIIFFAIKKALTPLTTLSQAIQSRQSIDLQPFSQDKTPAEIKPLVHALNLFMVRVSDMIGVLKRFTSDAAHELRTPITALKLQLTLIEQAKNKSERDQAIDALRGGIDRSEQLVSQLLTLAKIEPNSQIRELETIDLLKLVKESIGELLPLALAKSIDVGLITSNAAYIHAVRHEIKILINNIIDNAIRYSPINAKVDISVIQKNEQVILEINDSGEGIFTEDFERVFERFYRGQNKDAKGSGLGLSIVKEIADQHDAKIVIKNLNSGLNRGFSFSVIFTGKI